MEKAKQIASDAESLSDDELHKELSTLFMSLRDGHTLYKFPGPHSCYSVTQAISFSLALDINDTKIIVSEFNKNQQVLDISPNATKIALGDQVLQIDSMSIDEYYAKNKFMIGGANSDASKRAMLTFMAVRDGALSMMPMENTVTYLLQSRQSGEKYSVSLPWVSSKLGSCYDAWINGNPTMSKSRGLFDDKPKFKMQDTLLSKDVDDKMSLFSNNFVGDLNPFGIDFQDTLDPLLKYGIWKPGEDNIGVLQLKSFYPSSKDAVALTSQIRDLLVNFD